MAKEPSVSVTLRVPASIRELLRAAAEDDHRSMANMVEVLIIKHCKERGIGLGRHRKSTRTST